MATTVQRSPRLLGGTANASVPHHRAGEQPPGRRSRRLSGIREMSPARILFCDYPETQTSISHALPKALTSGLCKPILARFDRANLYA